MYCTYDSHREYETTIVESEIRSPWRIDYARLVHSPSFRRLQGKTQLYPGLESDFFRNRLTHSLEVAQISKSIAIELNHQLKLENIHSVEINVDICEFAGIAHDLGHPPFGHQGEDALDECMRDFGGFEGNAQTLRILSRIEKKNASDKIAGSEFRHGLNLTYRSLASILKYDNSIPILKKDRAVGYQNKPIKGYYDSEKELVSKIKKHVLDGVSFNGKFKSIECKIMDIADDIAYSTYDLEDGLKAGFYHPIDFLNLKEEIYANVASKVSKAIGKVFTSTNVIETIKNIFSPLFSIEFETPIQPDLINEISIDVAAIHNKSSRELASNGYLRTSFTSGLINDAVKSIKLLYNETIPSMSDIHIDTEIKTKIEVLKNLTYEYQILSPRLKVAEYRGKEIVKVIFKALTEDEGWRLMPEDYQMLFHHFENSKKDQMRVVCDFIAGMTDRYSIEFYGRLKSENPETIFKPF